MSEVKFACPVCGQHITADASTSGSQVECPSCFRKLIVPQASSSETKLVLSALEAGGPRPVAVGAIPARRKRKPHPILDGILYVLPVLLLAAAAAAVLYWYQGRVKKTLPAIKTQLSGGAGSNSVPREGWTRDPALVVIPNKPAAGSMRGSRFVTERTTMRGATLTFRHGRNRPGEVNVAIVLLETPAAGLQLQVTPSTKEPVPRVLVRWRDAQRQRQTEPYPSGYLLKLNLDQPNDGRVKGQIFLALPDEARSYLAGEFDAEIVKPRDSEAEKQK